MTVDIMEIDMPIRAIAKYAGCAYGNLIDLRQELYELRDKVATDDHFTEKVWELKESVESAINVLEDLEEKTHLLKVEMMAMQ